jgi:hypothetical protein
MSSIIMNVDSRRGFKVRGKNMVYEDVPAYDDAPNGESEETVAVLECENCHKACGKLHDVPEFNYKGCDACMEEAQHELACEIRSISANSRTGSGMRKPITKTVSSINAASATST